MEGEQQGNGEVFWNWMAVAQTVAHSLVDVRNWARDTVGDLVPELEMLDFAAELLGDSTGAADSLFDGLRALVPEGRLEEADVDAAAKLVAGVFAVPLLSEDVDGARAHVAHVVTRGQLGTAKREVEVLVSRHTAAGLQLARCARAIGLLPGDADGLSMNRYHIEAMVQAKKAIQRLSAAEIDVKETLVLLQSPRRGRFVQEADKALHDTIREVEKAIDAMWLMSHATLGEHTELCKIIDRVV
ncbi:hypothetical protein E2562_036578 [Oryza meyeriana var. granulata]|uniref:Uncharacterized protein n=1 Tax=Oryza meyeriana var. granulata TaxID=110450 RepID=A0A6G1EDI0_9ORYZ|nr:hypothetical protein E2562_036578 [Oryza meyeriana var. granulata]